MLDDLPEYVLKLELIPWLNDTDLRTLACCSQKWRLETELDAHWKPLCDQLWTGKEAPPRGVQRRDNGRSYKSAFWASKLDATRRNHMTLDELTGFSWLFSFRWFNEESRQQMVGTRFLKCGLYSHPGFGLMRWTFNHDEDGRHQSVQVERFPPLTFSRRASDWGWELQNLHAIFNSGGPLPPFQPHLAATGPDVDDFSVPDEQRGTVERAINAICRELMARAVVPEDELKKLVRRIILLIASAPSAHPAAAAPSESGSGTNWAGAPALNSLLDQLDDVVQKSERKDRKKLHCGCLAHQSINYE